MSDARHLQRLAVVWEKQPVDFITTCVAARRPVLANGAMHEILLAEWKGLRARHGWAVGRHVVMPDHVPFFMMPEPDGAKPLSAVIGKWKEWTAKQILKIDWQAPPFWPPEFFDHLLRSRESRSEKWTYVRENPVRAGLVQRAEDWPFSGLIDFDWGYDKHRGRRPRLHGSPARASVLAWTVNLRSTGRTPAHALPRAHPDAEDLCATARCGHRRRRLRPPSD